MIYLSFLPSWFWLDDNDSGDKICDGVLVVFFKRVDGVYLFIFIFTLFFELEF